MAVYAWFMNENEYLTTVFSGSFSTIIITQSSMVQTSA